MLVFRRPKIRKDFIGRGFKKIVHVVFVHRAENWLYIPERKLADGTRSLFRHEHGAVLEY